jgi:hypothetical protein
MFNNVAMNVTLVILMLITIMVINGMCVILVYN